MEKIQSIVTVQNKIVSTVKLADKTTVPPLDIGSLTCSQLNADLTEPQRQIIQRVDTLTTGALAAGAPPNSDGENQKGRLVNFLTLDCLNSFGTNTNRLTDSVGGAIYGAGNGSIPDYFIDHATKKGWQFNTGFTSFGTVTWDTAKDAAAAHDNGTFSNFALPDRNEATTILNDGVASNLLNYAPLNIFANLKYWTSTPSNRNPLFAWAVQTAQTTLVIGVQKIGTAGTIYVRNHF